MYYSEKQTFKYSVNWYIVSAAMLLSTTALLLMLLFNIKELDTSGILALTIIPLVLTGAFVYISTLELSIKIDKNRLSYRLVPLFSDWKHIIRRDIVSFEVKKIDATSSVKKQSKSKASWIGKHKRFILLGKQLLELDLDENAKVTLSTLHGVKIKVAMQELMNPQ